MHFFQNQQELYHRVVAKCWADPEFKSRLLADPKAVLTAEGFSLSEGSTIRVIEVAKDEVLFLIPHNLLELTDEQLSSVAGGRTYVDIQWNCNDPDGQIPNVDFPPGNIPDVYCRYDFGNCNSTP